jgi:hypothetical protein
MPDVLQHESATAVDPAVLQPEAIAVTVPQQLEVHVGAIDSTEVGRDLGVVRATDFLPLQLSDSGHHRLQGCMAELNLNPFGVDDTPKRGSQSGLVVGR